jgi:oligopeptidase A
MGWSKLVTDVAELSGMPESALAAARLRPRRKSRKAIC